MWVHQKQLYGPQQLPSYHSFLDASQLSLGASLPWYLMDNLERPLREGLDQGVPLPLIESPPLVSCSSGDSSSSLISPLSSSSGESVVISSGGSLWVYLLPVREVEGNRAEVSSVKVDHSSGVEGSGEGSSRPSPDISESSSGWWFSPERRRLPEL